MLASSLDLQLVVLPFCLSREAQCRELMQAIFVNSTEEVEAILQRPQDPNLKPDSQDAQDAALHLALQLRRSDIVQLLLEAWADVDKPDGRGSSPVFKAVDIHHLEALRALLAARADADKANSMGQTPLLQAAANGLTEAASLLVQAGADKELNVNGRTPLHTAVQGGHSGVVRVLLEARSDLNSVDRHGCTPLRMAAEVGDLVAMRLLLDAKADVDKGDFNSLSPLLVVLGNLEGQGGRLEGHGRLRLVRVLMEASADVNKARKPSFPDTSICAYMYMYTYIYILNIYTCKRRYVYCRSSRLATSLVCIFESDNQGHGPSRTLRAWHFAKKH